MNVSRRWLGVAVLSFALSACAQRNYLRLADPVGPSPTAAAAHDTAQVGKGILSVFTETDEVEHPDSLPAFPHSSYTVHDLRGRLLKRVRNHSSDESERPDAVQMLPGTYLIRARGLGKWVEVIVRIEAYLTTEVYLDRSWAPAEGTPESTVALTTDGTPIGWHARAGSALGTEGELRYEGSSTVALFVGDAKSVFTQASFSIDDRGESEAGEVAVLGTADIGGVARDVLNPAAGVECKVIGYDAVVVIVRADSEIEGLTREQLAAIFSGEVTNWSQVGGADKLIQPLIVGEGSATRTVFRKAVMSGKAYKALEVVPDRDIINRVARSSAQIGQVSRALLRVGDRVRLLAVDGQKPSANNPAYPIVRPLNVCIRRGGTELARNFVKWALSSDGQTVVKRRFIGVEPSPLR